MDLSQVTGSVFIDKKQPIRLENGYGRRIAVLEGRVWVTQYGDRRDVVLQTGEEFVFDRPVTAMVSALRGNARIIMQEGIEIGSPRRKGLFNAWTAFTRAVARWQGARQSPVKRTNLRAMSDYALADIGLRRAGCAVIRSTERK